MKVIFYILQKEFIQIFRNKVMMRLIFIMPVAQLLILVNAATFELKRIDMVVVNLDQSSASRALVSKFEGSPFFQIKNHQYSMSEAKQRLLDNTADIILYIPPDFERNLLRNNKADLQFLINAIDGMAAGLANVYASEIVRDFQKDIHAQWLHIDPEKAGLPIQISHRYWFNPNLNYKIYMLPGILVILVTIIGMFLTALNIVREKELGTIEQINVTPIKKYQFITGKLIPFMVIALFELSFGLLIGRLFFSLPMEGSLLLVFLVAIVFLMVALGLGLFLSSISSTQQQVMFTIFFFLLTFILMSGIFTPAESMPQWAHKINVINPFTYFMRAIRMILLKGSGFMDILNEFISLSIYAVFALSLAVWRYRKTV